jgi:hypothetical protein
MSTVLFTSILAWSATKVMMVHLTTIDCSASLPIVHYPTQTATAQFMAEKVKQ